MPNGDIGRRNTGMGFVAGEGGCSLHRLEGDIEELRAAAGRDREQARRAGGTERDGRSHLQGEVGSGAASGG